MAKRSGFMVVRRPVIRNAATLPENFRQRKSLLQRSEVSKARGCAALRSEITLAGVGVFVQSAGAGHHGGSQGRYTQWCAKAARVSAWFLWFGDEGFGEGGGDVVYPVWKIAFFLAPKAGPRWRHKLETRATTASTHENQAHPCEIPRTDIDGCQAQIAT